MRHNPNLSILTSFRTIQMFIYNFPRINSLNRRPIALMLVAYFITSSASAVTYYSVDDGDWDDPIWSTVCSTCPGSVLPDPLSANDIIIIDDQVTIASSTETIGPTVTIIIRTDTAPNTTTSPAKLIFRTGGKLVLTSASSMVILENTTGNPANDPQIDGSNSGASNIISIGGVQYWKANDGDVIGVGTLQPGGTLPITLISFEAKKLENTVELKWITAMERNFSHFEIERSVQNLHFISIGRIDGQGGLDILTPYTYEDVFPENGKIYYRLKSVDHDLTFEYSPVVVVEVKVDKFVMVYPNPTAEGRINVRTNFSPEEGDHIEIYNNVGLKLFEFDAVDYENVLDFNGIIKQGSYLLRYVSSGHTQVIRFHTQ